LKAEKEKKKGHATMHVEYKFVAPPAARQSFKRARRFCARVSRVREKKKKKGTTTRAKPRVEKTARAAPDSAGSSIRRGIYFRTKKGEKARTGIRPSRAASAFPALFGKRDICASFWPSA